MRGPLLKQLIDNRKYDLSFGETLEDLEKMYTIVIESRGKTLSTLTSFDENVALASLCQISFPGKTPKYSEGSKQLRNNFRGISTNLALEQRFKDKIRYSLKSALNESEISLDDIRNLFFD